MATIAVAGTGYVGLVSGACLADFGNTVVCVDTDLKKIQVLEAGKVPIYESGLEDVIARNVAAKRLRFSLDLVEAVRQCEVVFIAVGTPPADDGSADLTYVERVAREIGAAINGYKVIVDKSTVPVGTGRKVRAWIAEALAARGAAGDDVAKNLPFDVVSNPEFLREGSAVQDFMHPDRVVIGAETDAARNMMKEVYRALYLNETPYIETNLESAEMIKYASNAFLAVKITFINEIANLCEAIGANIQDVAKAMGRDGRIGGKFLHPGPGYGGSCFPKDTQALARIGRDAGSPLAVVEATINANDQQKQRMIDKIEQGMGGEGSLKGKKIAVLGLAFKPNTDDMREAPSLVIIQGLVQKGALISACDPVAIHEALWRLESMKDAITFGTDEYAAIDGADALVVMTEWNQYRNLDLERVKRLLTRPIFFDLRNVYKRKDMKQKGFDYFAVGQ
ncbi:MAG: UDP-glucose/GDP-mannose dehydrogenase family protein [Treponema sp.]|jgi:UDPglucose 6-dehydrogenase|nr:UDP-glucose/GDP-mannose dehydrogenase family protein [Treponema sp.]